MEEGSQCVQKPTDEKIKREEKVMKEGMKRQRMGSQCVQVGCRLHWVTST